MCRVICKLPFSYLVFLSLPFSLVHEHWDVCFQLCIWNVYLMFLVAAHCDALHDLAPFVQFKNVKNTDGGVLLLVKVHPEACNFTKSNTPSWVFFTFFKLYKWYQIAQFITETVTRWDLSTPVNQYWICFHTLYHSEIVFRVITSLVKRG